MNIFKRKTLFKSKFESFKPIIEENEKIVKEKGVDELILRHFEQTQGYRFDLNNPKTFNEKLAARKREDNPLYSLCADKIAVRAYVESKIGKDYLIPLYYSGKHLRKSVWNKLPEEFVAKTNNGSGTIDVIRNKSLIHYKDLYNELEDWLSIKFGYISGELFYEDIRPQILIEKLLLDSNGNVPKDYKVHCFNGKSKKKIVMIDYDRFSCHKRAIYDENFNKLDATITIPQYEYTDEKPKNWDKLLAVADKLSEDFKYVRVDLYDVDGDIYFGELTFCESGAGGRIQPISFDEYLGECWN